MVGINTGAQAFVFDLADKYDFTLTPSKESVGEARAISSSVIYSSKPSQSPFTLI